LVRSSPILEYSSTALLVITLVGATTAFFAATCGLVQNDIKRIIAFSTISQLGYHFLINQICIIISLFNQLNIDLEFSILMLCNLPLSNFTMKDKDKFLSLINDKDCFTNFSFNGKSIIKTKYHKKQGIYLWVNNINNRSYVGKSVNLYQRLSKYLSTTYIQKNKNKMAICSAIDKYGIDNFTLYILETITVLSTDKPSEVFIKLRDKENYWYNLIVPSYNIQAILQPFTGTNHYRFGSSLPPRKGEEVKLKISNTLKGRVVSEEVKANHIAGARKKPVYCYDFETGKYLMEFSGLRIMARALNLNNAHLIRRRLDKNIPLNVTLCRP